jgi:hypothetical protein
MSRGLRTLRLSVFSKEDKRTELDLLFFWVMDFPEGAVAALVFDCAGVEEKVEEVEAEL